MSATIVERIIKGEQWWVDSETGRTYGLCRVVTETQARLKFEKRKRQAAAKALKAPTIKESDIEAAIVQAMTLDGWRAFKMEENFSERKKKKTGEPGMCDHLFVRPLFTVAPSHANYRGFDRQYVELLWWEFKAAKEVRKRAEFLSVDQVKWQQLAEVQGFLVWSAGVDHEADIAGAAQHYLDSGLAHRRELFVALIPPEARALPDRPRRLGDGE